MAFNGIVSTAAPERSPFGLLSPAATVIEDRDPHWTSGFSYETTDCSTQVKLRGICAAGQAVTAVAPVASEPFRRYVPFSVETSYECSTFGVNGRDDYQTARRHLDACFQKAVEYELWTGALSRSIAANAWDATANGAFPNRFLASQGAVDVTPTSGSPVKPAYGLALLEGAIADCGCGYRGTIHGTRSVSSALAVSLTRSTDDTLMTPIGNYVVAGSGYDRSGPDGSKPTGSRAWMYATGPVTVRRSSSFTVPDDLGGISYQAVDISNNTIKVYAEESAAVTWDGCCLFAVLVDLAADYS